MSFLNGPGSRLFEMRSHHPGLLHYIDAESGEPLDPPRFLIADLPDDLRLRFLEHGETWPRNENPFAALIASGVAELEWRQPLRHIELNLYSEDVFGAMQDLLPNDVRSVLSITLSHGGTRRRYHQIDRSAAWPVKDGDLVATRAAGLVVAELCRPPLDESQPTIYQAVASAPDNVELAFPTWMDRPDRILNLNSSVVTTGFVERWNATPIGCHLKEANYEHDLWFVESAGGYKKRGRPVAFRWVDASVPDWVGDVRT